ncbi:MAG: 2-amino-4-hydroxy-6-hydroxymethyldihydropteridine diphosphokinase [Bacteroidetes bacterium]|nr:2-amino-4-hydroxy-6-hydroxymethyldihydropteridine diphosphokinase [Bacteroidota bacterium]
MVERVFIGLGSNIEPRRYYIERAVTELQHHPEINWIRASSLYETEPVGVVHQPYFVNMVVEVQTSLPPDELLRTLKDIEHRVGRIERERWGPREIDLDILLYGDVIIETDTVRIPHPCLARRRFVLEPLVEIAAEFCDPLSGKTLAQLLEVCHDTSYIQRIE